MWKVGGTDMRHSVPEPVRIWWYKRAHLCDLFTELCHIILFLMNQRKERVRVTQSADAEKRGNDEAERAKKRCVIRMGLQAIVGRKPNATVFGPEWIHCVLRSACVRLLKAYAPCIVNQIVWTHNPFENWRSRPPYSRLLHLPSLCFSSMNPLLTYMRSTTTILHASSSNEAPWIRTLSWSSTSWRRGRAWRSFRRVGASPQGARRLTSKGRRHHGWPSFWRSTWRCIEWFSLREHPHRRASSPILGWSRRPHLSAT